LNDPHEHGSIKVHLSTGNHHVNSESKTIDSVGELKKVRKTRMNHFPSFSTEDRAMVVETLTALKGTLDEALRRAAKRSTKLA